MSWRKVTEYVEFADGRTISFQGSIRRHDGGFIVRVWHDCRTFWLGWEPDRFAAQRAVELLHDAWREDNPSDDGYGLLKFR